MARFSEEEPAGGRFGDTLESGLSLRQSAIMRQVEEQSTSAARVVADALPWLIEQAEIGKLTVPAYLLRSALIEMPNNVREAEARRGWIAPITDFRSQIE